MSFDPIAYRSQVKQILGEVSSVEPAIEKHEKLISLDESVAIEAASTDVNTLAKICQVDSLEKQIIFCECLLYNKEMSMSNTFDMMRICKNREEKNALKRLLKLLDFQIRQMKRIIGSLKSFE